MFRGIGIIPPNESSPTRIIKRSENTPSLRRQFDWIFNLSIFSVTVLVLFLLAGIIRYFWGTPESWDYAIVIDAGSHGSRLHLFRWPPRQYDPSHPFTGPVSFPEDVASVKVTPGISLFSEHPPDVILSLEPLVTFAKNVLSTEGDRWSSIPLYLKATAGMRDLNRDTRDEIMLSIRDFFSNHTNSPFYFRPDMARVISGEEEGAFGWMSSNLAAGSFFGNASTSVGAMDMGGASMQITFIPHHTSILESLFPAHVGGYALRLYTHSYLGYGWGDSLKRVTLRVALTALESEAAHEGIEFWKLPHVHPPNYNGTSEILDDVDSRKSNVDFDHSHHSDIDEKNIINNFSKEQKKILHQIQSLPNVNAHHPCYPKNYNFKFLIGSLLDPDVGKVRVTETGGHLPRADLYSITDGHGDAVEHEKSRHKDLLTIKVGKGTDKLVPPPPRSISRPGDETASTSRRLSDSHVPEKRKIILCPPSHLHDPDDISSLSALRQHAAVVSRLLNPTIKNLSLDIAAMQIFRDSAIDKLTDSDRDMLQISLRSIKKWQNDHAVSGRTRAANSLLGRPLNDGIDFASPQLRTELTNALSPYHADCLIEFGLSQQMHEMNGGDKILMDPFGGFLQNFSIVEMIEDKESEQIKSGVLKPENDSIRRLSAAEAGIDTERMKRRHEVRASISPFAEETNVPRLWLDKEVTVIGTGNAEECRALAQSLFYKDAPCFTHTCAFNGVYQPRLLNSKFQAFGQYGSMREMMGVPEGATPEEFAAAAGILCNRDLDDLIDRLDTGRLPGGSKSALVTYCWKAMWSASTLLDGYEFPRNATNLAFKTSFADDSEPGWTSGAAFYEVNMFFWTVPTGSYETAFWIALIGLLVSVIVLSVIIPQLASLRKETARTHPNFASKRIYSLLNSNQPGYAASRLQSNNYNSGDLSNQPLSATLARERKNSFSMSQGSYLDVPSSAGLSPKSASLFPNNNVNFSNNINNDYHNSGMPNNNIGSNVKSNGRKASFILESVNEEHEETEIDEPENSLLMNQTLNAKVSPLNRSGKRVALPFTTGKQLGV